MKLHIENIGKLKNADVILDGITVIAGKNNTGKSTVGKTLYCIFNSLYNIDEKIELDRKEYIADAVLSSLGINIPFGFLANNYKQHVTIFDNLVNEIKSNNLDTIRQLLLKINSLFRENFEVLSDYDDVIDNEIVENIINRVQEAITISDQDFYNKICIRVFNGEFSNQIVNFNAKTGKAILKIKDKDISIELDNKNINANFFIKINKDIIYIDNPFVINNISNYFVLNYVYRADWCSYTENLIYKLNYSKNIKNYTSEIITQNKLEHILKLLSDIGIGNLADEPTDFGTKYFKYKEENSDNKIEISNISAGIKTFIILKTLILNGQIADKGCIILDEPEVHLHPEWQLVFARLIVLLQKNFNLHILLNTHSPYFLRAIQVYSSKYEIADRCNYYLAENNEDGTASIRDVKGSIEEIYKLLHRPFQDLENE